MSEYPQPGTFVARTRGRWHLVHSNAPLKGSWTRCGRQITDAEGVPTNNGFVRGASHIAEEDGDVLCGLCERLEGLDTGTKRCPDCGLDKPLSEYHPRRHRHQTYCKPCMRVRRISAKNPTRKRKAAPEGAEFGRLHIRMPQGVYKGIKSFAAQRKVSMTVVAIEALVEYLEAHRAPEGKRVERLTLSLPVTLLAQVHRAAKVSGEDVAEFTSRALTKAVKEYGRQSARRSG